MGKINQLSFAVANLIAAGEVVDRPASVVKELLENSIDAGADNITVEIKHGGVSLIRVTDNGCGISKDDLPLAVKRHATSKISGAEDLDSIITLGFRGEALAAISAVSDVKIISKTKDTDFGYLLLSTPTGGVDVSEVGCADGTTVLVENLFLNVPARRKFLKKDVTEAIAVSAVVEKVALSRPGIAFTYIIDGQRRFSTSGDGKIKNTVYAVLGRDFASRLVEVRSEYDGISVYGFIGRSDNCRANRNMQNFFINGRYVKSKTATAAIEQAYTSYIAEGKFPVCVLFIDISPFSVDVNVHPAKLEVKFSNEKAVFEAVYYAVKSAMDTHTAKSEFVFPSEEKKTYIPQNDYEYAKRADNFVRPTQNATFRHATNSFVPINVGQETGKRSSLLDYDTSFRLKNNDAAFEVRSVDRSVADFHTQSRDMNEKDEIKTASAEPNMSDSIAVSVGGIDENKKESADNAFSVLTDDIKADMLKVISTTLTSEPNDTRDLANSNEIVMNVEPYRIIGVCFNTYILVEQSDTLLIIDKHAAHERIIFEQLKKNLTDIDHTSQMMMIPIEIKLSHEECSAALDYADEISDTGFVFTLDQENNMAVISAIPDMLSISQAQDLFITVLDNLSHNRLGAEATRDLVYEKALYQSSCKAAVKGGRPDFEENIKWICDTLMSIPDIKVCPHGRPVVTELGKRYIDRQFERIK